MAAMASAATQDQGSVATPATRDQGSAGTAATPVSVGTQATQGSVATQATPVLVCRGIAGTRVLESVATQATRATQVSVDTQATRATQVLAGTQVTHLPVATQATLDQGSVGIPAHRSTSGSR